MIIELLFKYIRYDIDQLTWRYGIRLDEEKKEVGQTSVDNESDVNLIRRFAVTGTAKLRRILEKYVKEKVEDADDTLPVEKVKWGFKFFDDVTADGHALAELMHWFIVRFCMWQWCKMFAPEQAPMEKQELDEVKVELDKILRNGDSGMPRKETLIPCPLDEVVITNESAT